MLNTGEVQIQIPHLLFAVEKLKFMGFPPEDLFPVPVCQERVARQFLPASAVQRLRGDDDTAVFLPDVNYNRESVWCLMFSLVCVLLDSTTKWYRTVFLFD